MNPRNVQVSIKVRAGLSHSVSVSGQIDNKNQSMSESRAGNIVNDIKKFDASNKQPNIEKFLISFDSLRFPKAIMSKLELDAYDAKFCATDFFASFKFLISNALLNIILHFFTSINNNDKRVGDFEFEPAKQCVV
ncbi:hypothetical protein BpHYR1_051122 [Brachionus plicatilis]|uniref:Uncharacterized protein n=1 Tax=Brachionus plicatilis TaxID=10195 RepID=A0A3M7PGR6_BRAPC|nr:hypothetical protein BpHYR1_051122 [Brachionus plicatilis]